MKGILDSMMAKPKEFFPESVAEYTALQLARKLGDTDRLENYVSLLDHMPVHLILEAFRSAQAGGFSGKDLIIAFEDSIAALTKDQDDGI